MRRNMMIVAACSLASAWGCGVQVSAPQSTSFGGPKAGWAEVAPSGGRFTVLMPGKPDEGTSKEPAGEGKEIEHHSFALIAKPNAYVVDYVDMDFDLPEEGKAKFYDAMRDGNIESRQAKLVEEKDITVDGVVGRSRVDEQETKAGPFVMMTRSFLAGRRYFTVMASAPKAILNSADAAKFLDSFHMTKAAEEPSKDAK